MLVNIDVGEEPRIGVAGEGVGGLANVGVGEELGVGEPVGFGEEIAAGVGAPVGWVQDTSSIPIAKIKGQNENERRP